MSLFAIYLGVPQTGHQFYSAGQRLQLLPHFVPKRDAIALTCKNPNEVGNEIGTNDLKSPHDLRFKILDWNVINKHGNHNEVPASAIALLWCLEHGIAADLAYFVAKRMSGLVTNKTRGLPYSMLLNNLFANLQIPLSQPRQITANPLDALTMKRMKSKNKRVREDDINEQEEEENIYHGTAQGRTSGDASGSGVRDDDDPFYNLTTSQKLDHLHREQNGLKKLLLKIANKLGCSGSPPRE